MRLIAIILVLASVLLVLGCDPPAAPRAPKGAVAKGKEMPGKKGGKAGLGGMSPDNLMVTEAGKHADERLGSALKGRQ